MEIKSKLRKALIGGLAGIALLTGANKSQASPLFNEMAVSTIPNKVYCERGKDYELRVYADSTMNPTQTIERSQWDVAVPSSVTIIGARLPSLNNPSANPDDFFYNVLMIDQDLKINVVNGELQYNWRNGFDDGAKNKRGLLEIIDFRVNEHALLGNANFDLNDLWFLDSDLILYDSTYWGVLPSLNTKFKIVMAGDANIDGRSDIGDLGILAANYGQYNKTWEQGDFTQNGKVDIGDLGILAANYGNGIVGSPVPDASTLGLMGLGALGLGFFNKRRKD